MTSSKKSKTYPSYDVISTKLEIQNLLFLYSELQDFPSLESLNSFLAQSAAELWVFGFLRHNFGSRNVRKPIKPSKTRII